MYTRACVFMQKDLSAEESALIDRAFRLFDEDGSGEIEVSEIEAKLQDFGFGKETTAAVAKVLASVDTDGSSKISPVEFKDLMTKKLVGS